MRPLFVLFVFGRFFLIAGLFAVHMPLAAISVALVSEFITLLAGIRDQVVISL